jgi:ATP-dependent RNA helicase DeaD
MQAYDTKRFAINVGRVHKVNAGAIVRLVCENCGVKSNQIGAIDLGRDTSFFEVSKEASNAIRQGMENLQLDGRPVSIRSASGQGGGQGGGRPHQGGRPDRKR